MDKVMPSLGDAAQPGRGRQADRDTQSRFLLELERAQLARRSAALRRRAPAEPGHPETAAEQREAARRRAPTATRDLPARWMQPLWPRVNVHALLRGAGAEVWVRDASLGEAQSRRLASRLRAELRAAGSRLERLTVNGETSSIEEGTWPSKQSAA